MIHPMPSIDVNKYTKKLSHMGRELAFLCFNFGLPISNSFVGYSLYTVKKQPMPELSCAVRSSPTTKRRYIVEESTWLWIVTSFKISSTCASKSFSLCLY